MGMAKRQLEDFEELRHTLEQLAVNVGAVEYDGDVDRFISKWSGDAESHAYARATILYRKGKLGRSADLPEIRELLRDILDGARSKDRDD